MKEKLRFLYFLIKEEFYIFMLTVAAITMCMVFALVPFLPYEAEQTPYDELLLATGKGTSVQLVNRSRFAYYKLILENNEAFRISDDYFQDYLQNSSKRTLEKKLKEMLISDTEIHIKYDVNELTHAKIVQELYVGNVEVIPYQNEEEEDKPTFAVSIFCILAFLLFAFLSVVSVIGLRKDIRQKHLEWNDMTEEEKTAAISIRRKRNSRD